MYHEYGRPWVHKKVPKVTCWTNNKNWFQLLWVTLVLLYLLVIIARCRTASWKFKEHSLIWLSKSLTLWTRGKVFIYFFAIVILHLRDKFETVTVLRTRLSWITKFSDHRRVWNANFMHTMIQSTRIRYLTTRVADFSWDTSTSSQFWNCNGVVLEIYLNHKFHWAQEGLNCEPLTYHVFT